MQIDFINPNRLLLRQIKKSFPTQTYSEENLNDFLMLVNEAYNSFEEDRLFYHRVEKIGNQEIEKINLELQAKNDFLDTFNHGMAHDIKNHTSNIIGLISMLKKYTEAKNLDMIKAINEELDVSSQQLTSIVQGFLYLSRGESKIDSDYSIIVPEDIINGVKLETQFLMRGKNVSLNYHFELNNLFYSQHIIKIILVNLVSNSVKYSKYKVDCIIDVSLKQTNNILEISVKDNGIGMDLENSSKKLYNLFGNLGKFGEKGFGVGLFLIKKIVDRNNGEIRMESKLGEGTEVKIKFDLDFNKETL